jgi:hypothetical protein
MDYSQGAQQIHAKWILDPIHGSVDYSQGAQQSMLCGFGPKSTVARIGSGTPSQSILLRIGSKIHSSMDYSWGALPIHAIWILDLIHCSVDWIQ